jgi:hypothetical protein
VDAVLGGILVARGRASALTSAAFTNFGCGIVLRGNEKPKSLEKRGFYSMSVRAVVDCRELRI